MTCCSLLSPAQILAKTHRSVHGLPFLAHDPDTVGIFPVLPVPMGKVSISLFLIDFFEEFAAPTRRFTRVHCGQASLNLKWFHSNWLNELIRSGSVTCGILISTLFSLQPVWFKRELLLLQCMDPAMVWHPLVDTSLLMLIHSITPLPMSITHH